MKKRIITLLLILGTLVSGIAQSTFPVNGAPHRSHAIHAFINATIYVDFETVIQNGTLLIQDGKVLTVGTNMSVPANAIVNDLKGKYIYPSFIDIYSDYGLPPQKHERKEVPGPQMESNVKGAYGWNQAIRAHYEAYKQFHHAAEKAEEYRKNGFGVVLSASKDGIVRGSGALVLLNKTKENESIITDRAAAFYSFNKGSSTQDYPSSLTGAIALLRQTYYDAAWYKAAQNNIEYNISLAEFNRLQTLPSIFEVNDKFSALRAAKVGK